MDAAEALSKAIRTVPDFPEPGIQFKDITPILGRPALLRQAVEALAEPFLEKGITQVIGVEARGFILGGMLAARLGAGFVPVRKNGKLPLPNSPRDLRPRVRHRHHRNAHRRARLVGPCPDPR